MRMCGLSLGFALGTTEKTRVLNEC